MARLERILVVLLGISLAMRFLRWDGALIMGLLTTFLLSVLYFPLGFTVLSGIRARRIFSGDAYRERPALVLVLAVVVGMFLATAVTAVQFSLMAWTGAAVLRVTALVGLGLMLVIVLVLRRRLLDGGRGWLTRGVAAVMITLLAGLLPPLPARSGAPDAARTPAAGP